MPIHSQINLFLPGNYPVGRFLERHARQQFAAVRDINPGTGIGHASCDAALAIQPAAGLGYPVFLTGGHSFSIVFGNSQLCHARIDAAANWLGRAPGPNQDHNSSSFRGQHAEQVAIGVAMQQQLPLFAIDGVYQIWTTIPPCGPCQIWYGNVPGQFRCYSGGPVPSDTPKRMLEVNIDKPPPPPSGPNRNVKVAPITTVDNPAKRTKITS